METPLVALHLLFRVAHMGGKIRHKLPGFTMRSTSLLRFGSEWSAGPARFLRANYNDCELLCLDTHIGMSHPSACKEGKLLRLYRRGAGRFPAKGGLVMTNS